jgi:myo-inositol-1(or 4)-monophosphatase
MFHDVAALFASIAEQVAAALRAVDDWGPSGRREGQYAVDLVADQIVLDALAAAGLNVLSEESGLTFGPADTGDFASGRDAAQPSPGGGPLVIVDPLDGSTNASLGVPWYATSLCLADADGFAVGLVRNQVSGVTYTAIRGEGAFCDGRPIRPSGCDDVSAAVIGISGLPPRHLGWAQFRALGASALDLCLVASGALDGFVDCSVDAHGVWDYAAATLICHEAGALVVDGLGRELLVRDPTIKRTPVAGATPELLQQLVQARGSFIG